MSWYHVCGMDPCIPYRPGPRSTKPAKLPVWVSQTSSFLGTGSSSPKAVWVGSPPRTSAYFDLLVAERPHTKGKSGDVACITMGVWAGWLAAQVQAKRTVCLPATVWKDILIPRFGNMKKAQFCANIVQMMGLKGLDPKVDADQDIIDAHGLCAVAAKLASEGAIDKYKRWELKL